MLKLPWRKERREPPPADAIDDAIESSKAATEEAREATAKIHELTTLINATNNGKTP